jgi:putative DNA primase/helicase
MQPSAPAGIAMTDITREIDALADGARKERMKKQEVAAAHVNGTTIRKLRCVNVGELLAMEIPPREMLLSPILPRKGLMMVYSRRGVGKTHLSLGIAYAVASGGKFLNWSAPEPRRVLLIDGEMPLVTLQERLGAIVAANDKEPPGPDFIRLIAADHQPEGIPDISTAEGMETLEPHIADGVDLIILDNLSTLCRSGKENESESWGPVQEWLLMLRRRGISVLFVHHAGKGGAQRGTSKREDVLDTVVSLIHPEDYQPDQGARFEVHFEKLRGFVGDDAKPFEVRLEVREGQAIWTMRDLEDVTLAKAADLFNDGMSVREVAADLGISKSVAARLRKKAVAQGLIDDTAKS